MKKIILLLTVVSFAACKDNPDSALDTNKNLVLVDTSGLSKSNAMTDVRNGNTIPATTITTTTENSRASTHAIYANGTSTRTTVPRRDRGWSDAAKGTAVGAGTGAIVGALVSKNKGTGALVGALVGGGGGYLFGRHRDRKSGRVARHKAIKAAGY